MHTDFAETFRDYKISHGNYDDIHVQSWEKNIMAPLAATLIHRFRVADIFRVRRRVILLIHQSKERFPKI